MDVVSETADGWIGGVVEVGVLVVVLVADWVEVEWWCRIGCQMLLMWRPGS